MRDHGVTEFPDRRLLNLLKDFVSDPDIIARVKEKGPR
jgi:hypothetical protein